MWLFFSFNDFFTLACRIDLTDVVHSTKLIWKIVEFKNMKIKYFIISTAVLSFIWSRAARRTFVDIHCGQEGHLTLVLVEILQWPRTRRRTWNCAAGVGLVLRGQTQGHGRLKVVLLVTQQGGDQVLWGLELVQLLLDARMRCVRRQQTLGFHLKIRIGHHLVKMEARVK